MGRPGDQRRQAASLGTPRAAGLLPGAGDGARVAADHYRIHPADVHAEFERVGADQAEQLAVQKSALKRAALLWPVTGAVGADAFR